MHDELERFSASIPSELLGTFDALVKARGYPSRSEALRDVIRDYLVSGQWEESGAVGVGTLTLVYDHEQRALANTLTSRQHEHHHEVLASLHIHLDRQHCLEVIVLKGPASEIRHLADHLIGIRGVKHGKLVCTTTASSLP